MKEKLSPSILFLCLTAVLIVSGCSQQENAPTQPSAGSAPRIRSSVTPQVTSTTKGASIQATPNPIQVCDGSGLGVTTLSYKFLPPVKVIDVRVGSPAGGQLAHSSAELTSTTGKWVHDGAVFYLQDVSDGKSLTPENTLATVTVALTSEGCK